MMPISKQAARAWQSLIRVYASVDAVQNTLDRLEANREVSYGFRSRSPNRDFVL